jgi:hypothetical protein
MFIDPKKIHAAASASFCVRSCVRAALATALVCSSLVAAVPALAAGQDGPRRDDRGGPGASRQQDSRDGRDSRDQPRQVDPRSYEARAEEQRRAMQDNNRNAEMSRRVGRMTADERRDLRRQINEAGQEVYALPPRR